MPTMIPATHRDLLDTEVGILSTIGTDGYPQTTALWFLYDDDGQLRLSLNTTRQKAKNLRANPHVTFFILDCANPLRTLEVWARAEVAPDPDYVFAHRLGAKYGGVDLRHMDRPGEERVVVTLHPVRIIATNLAG
jgi:PPOX class probable F420-dependent enzyme